jgi:hypothetical protein
VTRVVCLVFVLSRVFVCLGFFGMSRGFSRCLYVYGCLDWFSIRGSCLSLSLIGNNI